MRSDEEWSSEVVAELEHYEKAVRKHPFFCNTLFKDSLLGTAEHSLESMRRQLKSEEFRGVLCAESLLRCEFIEAAVEYSRGNRDACIDELRDAIAVLNRMIDSIKTQIRRTGHAREKGQSGTVGVGRKPHRPCSGMLYRQERIVPEVGKGDSD